MQSQEHNSTIASNDFGFMQNITMHKLSFGHLAQEQLRKNLHCNIHPLESFYFRRRGFLLSNIKVIAPCSLIINCVVYMASRTRYQQTPPFQPQNHLTISTSSHNRSPNANNLRDIQLLIILRHVFTACNTQYFHPLMVPQSGEQLRRDKEVLAGVFFASNFNHTFMYHPLITGIHALVDFVDDTEWCSCE
jgi:hypothetical protein